MCVFSSFRMAGDNKTRFESLADDDPNTMRSESAVPEKSVQMKRHLGLHHGVAVIVGLIMGSGIWIAPKGVAEGCGSPGLILLVWIMAGGMGVVGALCMAELGTTFPAAGEKYHYLEKMFGPFVGFMYLWMYLMMFRPGANAIKVLTFAKYMLEATAPWLACPQSEARSVSTFLLAIWLACEYYAPKLVAIHTLSHHALSANARR